MKAIRLHKPEDPRALIYEDAPKPQPKEDEVLIHVHAAGVSPAELSWGHLSRPLPIPGHELSGTIVDLGSNITDHKTGEEVYGFTAFERDGAFAEYTIALPGEIAPKPHRLNHEEAAAVPLSALTAWQALFDHAHLLAEQTILVYSEREAPWSQS